MKFGLKINLLKHLLSVVNDLQTSVSNNKGFPLCGIPFWVSGIPFWESEESEKKRQVPTRRFCLVGCYMAIIRVNEELVK